MNQFTPFHFLLVFLSLSSISCGKSFNNGDIQEQPKVEKQAEEFVNVEIIEGSHTGQYEVLFTPSNEDRYSIIKHAKGDGLISELATGVVGEYSDEEVKSGSIYKYEFGTYNESKHFVKISEVELIIPLDLELNNDQELNILEINHIKEKNGYHLFNFNRLTLGKKSKIITNGIKAIIKVGRLLSNDGKIITFEEGSRAAPGAEGKDGGEIRIVSTYGNGPIFFSLRGQTGGQGINPPPTGEEGRGTKGKKGQDGKSIVKINGKTGEVESDSCELRPSPGSIGGKGQTGLQANPGLRGGNTGTVMLSFEASDNLNVNFELLPGDGGEPSLGGLGGPGGYGGEPGGEWSTQIDIINNFVSTHYMNEPDICSYERGPEGPRGDSGPTNISGEKGKIQSICIKNNITSDFKCFKENEK